MLKANITDKQKAGLYVDFYKLYKTGSPKGTVGLSDTEMAMKFDLLMREFLAEQETFPGRERLRRLGFKIEEPKNESKTTHREATNVGS